MIIYIVDDEKNNVELLEEYLKRLELNATIECFISPLMLLEKEKQIPCDIAFVDVSMPELDGINLASELKKIKKDTNIIFVTAYEEYTLEALNLFASGYLLKPVILDEIKEQLNNLRYPINNQKDIKVVCFGNFDLLVNGEHVEFGLKKSKELLAYLVDRRGAITSRKEVASILFEKGDYNRNQQKKLSQIYRGLIKDLKKYDAENIVIKNRNGYCVNIDLFDCDYYDYLKKNTSKYDGEYMTQYSWSDFFF